MTPPSISQAGRGLVLLLAFWVQGVVAAVLHLDVDAPEGRARQNVLAYLGEPPEVGSEREARAYARHTVDAVRRALEAVGYYSADIATEVAAADDGWRVTFRIDPGRPVHIRRLDVRVTGEGSDSRLFDEVIANLPLAEGDILDHGAYETAKTRLRNAALLHGYFDGEFGVHRIAVDIQARAAEITLVYDTGPRYELGEVTFKGELPFNDGLLRRLVPFDAGTPYAAERIAALSRNLLDSGYFGDVQVSPERDSAAPGGAVPVTVNATAREPNTLGFGAGFSTDEGPRARINWQRHWVNASGHTAGAELRVSAVRQNLSGNYTIPLRDPLDDELQLQAGFQREDIEDTRSSRATLAVRRRQHFDSGWVRVQSLRLLHEDFTQADQDATTTLLMPGLSFSRTRARGGIDPYWGDRQSYSIEVARRGLGSDVSMARALVGMKWLRTYFERHQISVRTDLGAIATSNFERIPSSLRFFAGGDNSVRGYGYNTLAPKDDDGELLGGRYLVTGSIEYGYRFAESWRAAVFTDAGNAFDEPGTDFKVGSGFGIRWLSPVGPVRLDFAWGVSESDPPFRIHISLGPPL